MRVIRYCWVLVLALISFPALAQSVAPTQQTVAVELRYYTVFSPENVYSPPGTLRADHCSAIGGTNWANGTGIDPTTPNVTRLVGYCTYSGSQRATYVRSSCPVNSELINGACSALICPAGYTLNPATNMCDPVPESCPPDQREWNGQCLPLCDYFQSVNAQTGACECNPAVNVSLSNAQNTDVSGSGSIPDTVCSKGCVFNVGEGIGLGGEVWYARRGTATGATCTVGEEPTETPIPPNNKPPCAANQGVMTSSSGTVACVPEGTPGSNKPKVQEKERKETFPDGSEKNTKETTTTDPKTGATNTTTTTTSTGGQSGSAGTTTSEQDDKPTKGDGNGGDGDGDCEGDDCGEGDGPDFTPPEGGDLYENSDRTIRNVIDDFVNAVSAAPAIQAAQSFFVPGSMPASCGGMSTNVPMIDVTVSLDEYLCGDSAQTIIAIAGVIVLAIAAFAAFRIGFL